MGQEFIIKSQGLEDKINQLLPSQGGFAAGVDLSASTTVIPIVDLTETAEGSSLRQDLQTSFGLNSETYNVFNITTTIINTTGYYRVFGRYVSSSASASGVTGKINITDGTTTKSIISYSSNVVENILYDVIIFLKAGQSCEAVAGSNCFMIGTTRQIADINGNLVDP